MGAISSSRAASGFSRACHPTGTLPVDGHRPQLKAFFVKNSCVRVQVVGVQLGTSRTVLEQQLP